MCKGYGKGPAENRESKDDSTKTKTKIAEENAGVEKMITHITEKDAIEKIVENKNESEPKETMISKVGAFFSGQFTRITESDFVAKIKDGIDSFRSDYSAVESSKQIQDYAQAHGIYIPPHLPEMVKRPEPETQQYGISAMRTIVENEIKNEILAKIENGEKIFETKEMIASNEALTTRINSIIERVSDYNKMSPMVLDRLNSGSFATNFPTRLEVGARTQMELYSPEVLHEFKTLTETIHVLFDKLDAATAEHGISPEIFTEIEDNTISRFLFIEDYPIYAVYDTINAEINYAIELAKERSQSES